MTTPKKTPDPSQNTPLGQPDEHDSTRVIIIAGADAAQAAAKCFQKAGCRVLACFNSAAIGLAEAGRLQPELALAEIGLCAQETDYQALRDLAEILLVPLLFITRFDDQALLEKAGRITPGGFISPEASPEEIRARVNECLKCTGPAQTAQRDVLHPLINTLTGGAFSTDLKGDLTYASKSAADMMGWDPDNALGFNVFDLIDPKDRELAINGFAEVVKGRPGPTVVIRMLHQNGSKLLCRITMHPLRKKNRVVGGVGVLEDVTSQYLAEVKLKESEERYRRMFDTAPVGLVHLGLNGRYIKANNRMHEMLEYDSGELHGTSWLDVCHPDEVDQMLAKDELLFSGKVSCYTLNKRYITKKGRTIWGRATVTLARDAQGNPDYFLAAVEDISVRREAELALAESERKYRDLVENANVAVLRIDENAKVVFLNRAARDLFGYEESELMGRSALKTSLLGDESQKKQLLEYGRKILRDPESFHTLEARSVSKDGRELWISWSNKALYSEDGELSGFLCMGADITHRKKDEEAKQELMNQLQHAQKMESIGTLASGIAHDFNNILQTISGYVHLLKLNPAKGGHLSKHLEAIDQTSQRGAFMVDRLLTLGRKSGTSDQVSDLNREVDQCISMLKRILPRKVRFRADLTKGPAMVRASASQIEQVMINLVNNASEAMPQGGEVQIKTDKLALEHDSSPGAATLMPGQYYRITVSDTGAGMDPITRERVFDPFFTTKSQTGGTGLGLSMVYGIVTSLNGAISCTSQPGGGSVFTIHLPLIQGGDNQAEPKRKTGGANLLGNETILLVDDEPAILETMSDSLMEYGYQVVTAASGEEAMEVLNAKPGVVDLVILDLDMPGMGGRMALGGIKEQHSGIKVIIISGYADPDMVESCLSAGASGFLPKPFQLTRVMELVRQVLEA